MDRPLPDGGGSDQIGATDRQIDRLVYDLYDLYGLTGDEIRIVDKATQK